MDASIGASDLRHPRRTRGARPEPAACRECYGIDSESANLGKLDAGVLNNILGSDRWPLRIIAGPGMARPVHLEIGSKMRGPFDRCPSRLRPLGGKSRDGVFNAIVLVQRLRETGGIVGRL